MLFAKHSGPVPERIGNVRQTGPIRKFDFESDFFSTPCLELFVDGKPLRYVESNRLAAKRVAGLFSKEPTTIPWLDSMTPDDVLVDIGGNVGMYSIYAGVVAGCRVFAIEPEALNYAELNKNIFVNGLNDRVVAFCAAASDVAEVGKLYLGAFGYAYSHHDFNENTWTEDKAFGDKSTPKDARLLQGCVSVTLDGLVASGAVPQPTHIKVDVDGLEHRVFAGMKETLKDPRLKTALIEIDHKNTHCDHIIDTMLADGWRLSYDQLRTNRKMVFTEEQVIGQRRGRKGGFNYIFFRDEAYADLFAQFLDGYIPPIAVPTKAG
ncbi:MAG: FkbM family methyltransferase [Hyphomonadaceae bacterium]|nr:FkbM family methyltransferase [Hyphomonadaceae bacterium]